MNLYCYSLQPGYNSDWMLPQLTKEQEIECMYNFSSQTKIKKKNKSEYLVKENREKKCILYLQNLLNSAYIRFKNSVNLTYNNDWITLPNMTKKKRQIYFSQTKPSNLLKNRLLPPPSLFWPRIINWTFDQCPTKFKLS